MNVELKEKTDLMIENFHELKNGFNGEMNLVKHFAAIIHASKGSKVDKDVIKKIKKYIKEKTSFISYFRGSNTSILAALLYFEDDYEEFFEHMLKVYNKLVHIGFKNSTYLTLASYTLVKEVPAGEWDYRIKRMSEFYEKMMDKHKWLTSTDDYVFAAILAITDLNIEETVEKIEVYYNYLSKQGINKGNDLQTLSHVLALGKENVEDKCNKVMKIYRGLLDKKCSLNYSGLASLGVLAIIVDNVDEMVNKIKGVYEYLYNKDGYGFWSLDKSMRTILASTIVSDFYIEKIKSGVLELTLGNSINTIIIAQQQAVVVAASVACAASVSTASS